MTSSSPILMLSSQEVQLAVMVEVVNHFQVLLNNDFQTYFQAFRLAFRISDLLSDSQTSFQILRLSDPLSGSRFSKFRRIHFESTRARTWDKKGSKGRCPCGGWTPIQPHRSHPRSHGPRNPASSIQPSPADTTQGS